MKEFIFDQAQLLALLSAVDALQILGIDNKRLFPEEEQQQQQLVAAGLEKLLQAGYLTETEGRYVLDRELSLVILTVAYPQFITIIGRNTPRLGRQEFVHYRNGPANVELTKPDQETYRLAALPDTLSALDRVRRILMVDQASSLLQAQHEMPIEQFLQGKRLAEQNQPAAALQIFQESGWAEEAAKQFIHTICSPEYGGTISLLRVDGNEVVDAREIAMVKENALAWVIYQSTPGSSTVTIKNVTASQYSALLLDAVAEIENEDPSPT